MNPQRNIRDLDLALDRRGEDAILTRAGTSVTIRVAERTKDRPNELVSGSMQDDLMLITSMTKIRAANWNTGMDGTRDRAIPRRGDRMTIKGVQYRIEASDPIAVKNIVVRVNLAVKGNTSGA